MYRCGLISTQEEYPREFGNLSILTKLYIGYNDFEGLFSVLLAFCG